MTILADIAARAEDLDEAGAAEAKDAAERTLRERAAKSISRWRRNVFWISVAPTI